MDIGSSSPSARTISGVRPTKTGTRRPTKAHLLRWRPRPHAQRTESTPRVLINSALVSRRPGAAAQLERRGAASHLDLFEPPRRFLGLLRGSTRAERATCG